MGQSVLLKPLTEKIEGKRTVLELKEKVNEDKTQHSNVFPEAVAFFIDEALNVHHLSKHFTEWNTLCLQG